MHVLVEVWFSSVNSIYEARSATVEVMAELEERRSGSVPAFVSAQRAFAAGVVDENRRRNGST